jgi:heme/copper-type cytochrome/quinol oxidase subunit 1
MDMPNPEMVQYMSQFASFAVVFPSGLTLLTIFLYVFRSRIKWNITSMFMLLGIAGWLFGGFAGIQTGWWGEDIYLHNTTHIVGHIHLVILMGSAPLVFGLIYSLIPEILGKSLNRSLGIVHLLSLTLGGYGLAILFIYLGYDGFVRRVADIPNQFEWAMPYLNFFALTVAFGMICFMYNFAKTLKNSKPIKKLN